MKRFKDPVVEEVRARGRKITARYGNNPRKIFTMLKAFGGGKKAKAAPREKALAR